MSMAFAIFVLAIFVWSVLGFAWILRYIGTLPLVNMPPVPIWRDFAAGPVWWVCVAVWAWADRDRGRGEE
jgi:hypothetical protein